MRTSDRARIQWLSPDMGGRRTLPSKPLYSTVACFEEAAADWSNVAWSIIAEFSEPPKLGEEMIATIRFLASDAPVELLHPGSRFELLEGERIVARGEVIG